MTGLRTGAEELSAALAVGAVVSWVIVHVGEAVMWLARRLP